MNLATLQRQFAEAIHRWGEVETDILQEILCPSGNAKDRIKIYSNNVYGNLKMALKAIFPICEKIVGKEFFMYSANYYIKANPSTSGNLMEYGMSWPEFLDNFIPAQQVPYLADIARLERIYHQIYYMADEPTTDLTELTDLKNKNLENLCVTLKSTVKLLYSEHPLARIWEVNQPEYKGNMQVNFDKKPRYFVVSREHIERSVKEINASQYYFLEALQSSNKLFEAYGYVESKSHKPQLESLLEFVLSNGMVNTKFQIK